MKAGITAGLQSTYTHTIKPFEGLPHHYQLIILSNDTLLIY